MYINLFENISLNVTHKLLGLTIKLTTHVPYNIVTSKYYFNPSRQNKYNLS